MIKPQITLYANYFIHIHEARLCSEKGIKLSGVIQRKMNSVTSNFRPNIFI